MYSSAAHYAHDRRNARISYAHQECQGHRVTSYYCGSKCHDCGEGYCHCMFQHCCCPQYYPQSQDNEIVDGSPHDSDESSQDNQGNSEIPQDIPEVKSKTDEE